MRFLDRLGCAALMLLATPVVVLYWVVVVCIGVLVGVYVPYRKDGLTFGVRSRGAA